MERSGSWGDRLSLARSRCASPGRTVATPSDSGCSLDSPSGLAAIGNMLSRVSQFADVGAHGAHGQVQRFGNLAFRLPFAPKADEQGIPL